MYPIVELQNQPLFANVTSESTMDVWIIWSESYHNDGLYSSAKYCLLYNRARAVQSCK